MRFVYISLVCQIYFREMFNMAKLRKLCTSKIWRYTVVLLLLDNTVIEHPLTNAVREESVVEHQDVAALLRKETSEGSHTFCSVNGLTSEDIQHWKTSSPMEDDSAASLSFCICSLDIPVCKNTNSATESICICPVYFHTFIVYINSINRNSE